MIRHVRRQIPWLLAFVLIAAGLTMGASATGGAPNQPGPLAALAEWIVGNVIALAGGFIAWTQLTLRAAKKRVEEALAIHNAKPDAHEAAAAHNHGPMNQVLTEMKILLSEVNAKVNTLVVGQGTAIEELAEQDARIGVLEDTLLALKTQHEIIHGDQLRKRSEDPPDFDAIEARLKRKK